VQRGWGGHGKALLSTEDAEGTEERREKKEGKSIVEERGYGGGVKSEFWGGWD
jgi:hypothetical protein